MRRWLNAWAAHREARVLARRAIPEALWALTLARLPFLAARPAEDLAELRRLTSLFLDRKQFTAAGGLAMRDDIAVCIAAQACLPVLRFGLAPYDSFVGIVVHPDEVVAQREWMDEDGIVHTWDEVLAGEAMAGGPVMLSWRDVAEAGDSAEWGYNVVVHEFAHVIDLNDGQADGVPPLPSAGARDDWVAVIDPAFEAHCAAVDRGEATLLDPYGAEGVDEFFAVLAETFFVSPQPLRQTHPALYRLMAGYFQQDPAACGVTGP